jgi:hypothetical protein
MYYMEWKGILYTLISSGVARAKRTGHLPWAPQTSSQNSHIKGRQFSILPRAPDTLSTLLLIRYLPKLFGLNLI